MPKHTFTETTTVNNKVFFKGDAEVSEADAKAVQTAAKAAEESEAQDEPKSKKGK